MGSESLKHKLDRVRRPRVQITYDVETGGAMQKVELPFVVGVLADLSGHPKEALRLALARSGATHASVASYNNHWGVPLSLARLPASARYAVFEMGMNHAGEIEPLARLVRPAPGRSSGRRMRSARGRCQSSTGTPVRADSTAANVTRVTCAACSGWIGEGRPACTASRNAANSAAWPLSWPDMRPLSRLATPEWCRVRLRKSSSTAQEPSTKTSRRSLGIERSPTLV